MKLRLLMLMLVMLALVPQAMAIGIAPATHDILMTKETYSYDIVVINDFNEDGLFEVELTGGLSDYITVSKRQFEFTPDKERDSIKVTLTIPSGQDLGDVEFTNRIIIRKVGKESDTVVARVGVAAKLVVTLPHEGPFVVSELFAPPFVNEVPNSFSVEGTNKGDEVAKNCVATINILNEEGKIIDTLVSESRDIPSMTMERFKLTWTPVVTDGEYTADASLICDGMERLMQKKFSVVSPSVRIESFTAEKFTLGEISKFSLILSTIWPEIRDVYGTIELMKDSSIVSETTTETKDLVANIPVNFPVYLDTSDVEPGKYTIIVTANYLEKELSEVFEAHISSTGIVLNSISGRVSGADKEGGSSFTSLLIIIIFVVVAINGYLAYRLLKKKK